MTKEPSKFSPSELAIAETEENFSELNGKPVDAVVRKKLSITPSVAAIAETFESFEEENEEAEEEDRFDQLKSDSLTKRTEPIGAEGVVNYHKLFQVKTVVTCGFISIIYV